ncbi:peptidylprolyl isomerase [Halopseudomonas pelagia]|uniref:Chaperone SurA n=1 Tax=Halopseudomonas pelagia TaxID=553151 RepID=A0AA91U1I7_9GAMM|nr:peptidylprolyl isomerase [Halopseudomonas pelagia]PCC98804.1 molecular chaperone SurA [Halopseudomonas pelagia]QFY58365.1 molecular chaperone SurA [Halopseudomonas pelagia]
MVFKVKVFKLYPALLSLCAGLIFSTGLHAQVVPLDRVAAIVDNDVVMASQLDQRMQELQRQLRERGTQLPPDDVLRQQVLDRLVVESIQLQMGERAGIRIDDATLNQTMEQLAQRNNVTTEQFRAALERDGISYDQAREQIRREMIINRVRQRRVAERIQVSDQEVRNFLDSEMGRLETAEEYRLAMIVLPIPESASPDEVRAIGETANDIYQELNAGADFTNLAVARSRGDTALEGGELGWRRSAQLPGPFASAVAALDTGEVTQPLRSPAGFHILKLLETRGGEGQMVEEFHVRHILIKPSEIRTEEEAAQLIQRIYERIRNGESFATLASAFSEDPGSALNGGSLDWVMPDSMVPEFREVMTEISENTVSAPFQSEFGWHILEVQGRRNVDMTSEMREQQAMSLLRNRKYEQELQTWLLEIRDEAYVEIKI